MLGSCRACAKIAAAHTAMTRSVRCARPAELGMSRKPRKTLRGEGTDRRAAHGNGTAFSALAPSKRPVFAAHQSNIREWYCPQARIADRLTFDPVVQFRAHCRILLLRPPVWRVCHIPPGN